jgi:hypothetical protein
MSRFLVIVVSFIYLSSLADLFRPEAEHFHPNVPIVWAVTNKLPSHVEVYETVQTNFSNAALSNAMAMGSFKPIDISSQSKDLIIFESRKNTVLVRCLKISQPQGSVDYFKSQTNYASIHGVPSFDETKRLALEYLRLFGGDTNQVSLKPSSRTEQTVSSYDKRGGTMTNKAVSARGIILSRSLNGIDCSDSLFIEFGNDATVIMLKLNWRYLKPHELIKTPGKNEILNMLKAGKAAVLPNVNGDDVPADARSFRIVEATPVYRLQNAKDVVYPFTDFEVIAESKTNAASFYIECPLVPISDHF